MDYAKKYLKYKDKATQDKFNKLVNELRIDMTLESAISLALAEIRDNKKFGGSLKAVPAGNKGLKKLPTEVRNKMGFMKKGGKVNGK